MESDVVPDNTDSGAVVLAHVNGFNSGDAAAAVAMFADTAVFVTGQRVVRGKATLREFFGESMSALRPVLLPSTPLVLRDDVEGDRVAVEIVEEIIDEATTYRFSIAGFYRVIDGLIVSAKIYREGSSDWTPPQSWNIHETNRLIM